MFTNNSILSSGILKLATAGLAITVLASCASAPKANIPLTANANEEVSKLETDIKAGLDRHFDVLATDDFTRSQRSLKSAQERIKEGDDQEDIIEDLAESRGYLERASQKAQGNAGKLADVLNARQAAVQAGARNYPKEKENLVRIDKDLRNEVEEIDDMKPETYGKIQKRYMELELGTIQTSLVGDARANIEGIEKKDGEDLIPQSLKKAREDLVNAENTIAANVKNPSGYQASVDRAIESAALALAVLQEAQKGDTKIPETVALDIVLKNRKIDSLNNKLSDRTEELNMSQQTASAQQRAIQSQGATLALNNMIKTLSAEFKKEDAEVYRQGDKLLIRLKGINFKSGDAELPGDTIPLLGKVTEAAQKLNAENVVVEGHTDAVGTARINKELSEKRAEAVAQYLETAGIEKDAIQTKGYGFEKPLASNKTKTGRAQNRRVDIIITPTSVAKDSSSETKQSIQ